MIHYQDFRQFGNYQKIPSKKAPKGNSMDKYSFQITHPSQIDYGKIAEDLSYTNPIAIINHERLDDPDINEVEVLIDDSIPIKAAICGIGNWWHEDGECGENDPDGGYTLVTVFKEELKNVIEWCRMVKQAPYPHQERQRTKITVSIVKV